MASFNNFQNPEMYQNNKKFMKTCCTWNTMHWWEREKKKITQCYPLPHCWMRDQGWITIKPGNSRACWKEEKTAQLGMCPWNTSNCWQKREWEVSSSERMSYFTFTSHQLRFFAIFASFLFSSCFLLVTSIAQHMSFANHVICKSNDLHYHFCSFHLESDYFSNKKKEIPNYRFWLSQISLTPFCKMLNANTWIQIANYRVTE